MAHPPYFANAQVFSVDPSTIDPDPDGRIGLFFPAWAEALASLIAAKGQNDPIKLVKNPPRSKYAWKLVTGLHRLAACMQLGIEPFAIEVNGDHADLIRIQESENVDRRELAPIERAMFVNAVAASIKARITADHGDVSQQVIARRARAAKAQFSDMEKADERASLTVDNLSTVYSWKAETAEACGLGAKDVQRAIRIFDCVVAPNRDLMDVFKDHPVAQTNAALLEIAAVGDAGQRRKLIVTLINGPKDLGYAMEMLGLKKAPTPPTEYVKFTGQIITGCARLGMADWRRACPEIVSALSPARRIELRDALNAKIGGGAE